MKQVPKVKGHEALKILKENNVTFCEKISMEKEPGQEFRN
jgi:hypothetical protein